MARERPRGVHRGTGGELFWLGPQGHMPSLYRRSPLQAWRLWRWRRLIAARRRRCAAMGARYVQLFPPDKLSVLADRAPTLRIDAAAGYASRLAGEAGVLDLLAPLAAARAQGEPYLHTDTHWSHLGYLAAYGALCAELGPQPAAHVVDAPTEVRPRLCDLGAKLPSPVEEPVATPQWASRAVRREANALVCAREARVRARLAPGLLVGSRVVLANARAADPRRLVLFGDSYAFHDAGLGAMLAESFAETHLLWSASIDWAYLERVRPDVVVHELAERFLRKLPRDGRDVDAFGDARAAQLSPTADSASA